MCGIAGYSVSTQSGIGRTLAAQALLAGIAERGADAVGYAFRNGTPDVHVHKQRGGAAGLLDRIEIPAGTTQALVHVRDYTKGRPTIEANNHPIRHGAVVGIHNGRIANDDAIFASFGFRRAQPEMTVDSEAIFALLDWDRSARVLERLRGTMATAWLDERAPGELRLARGVGRPLWLGRARHEVFFASTPAALEVVERTLRIGLRKNEVAEGAVLTLRDGRIESTDRFAVDRSYREAQQLPAVRAADEGAICLDLLAGLAAA
jgi:glucosamine 6-phosphate synthetase-like amidotransferase/phosphosugar isomerase protein